MKGEKENLFISEKSKNKELKRNNHREERERGIGNLKAPFPTPKIKKNRSVTDPETVTQRYGEADHRGGGRK